MGSKIAVIGIGYVGLTTGACLSHLGHEVICADVIPEKVDALNRGEIPILEAGLDELVQAGRTSGQLKFVLGASSAVADAEFIYLCVPTPQGSDGSADLSYIREAAAEIGPHLASESVVINKSTVPVGSTRVVEQALKRSDIHVVSNPEFLREGSAVNDFLHPDRVVIGADDQSAAIRVAGLYLGLAAPLQVTDPASAETIKYASNAFLATKISFVNAIAAVCEAVGADVNDVVLGMGYDKRIGEAFLRPGPGWGGSCFVGEETVLARYLDDVRLLRFDRLAAEIDTVGAAGWEVLAWDPALPTPEFRPISAFTRRPYDGDVIDIRTKMGRRLTVTADHPFVVGDGRSDEELRVTRAEDLSESDWLPLAQGAPVPSDDAPRRVSLLDAARNGGIGRDRIIARLEPRQVEAVRTVADRIPASRRRDVLRAQAMRVHEMDALDVEVDGATLGTTTNGTYVPTSLDLDEDFWRMLGLFLAEGHIGTDGARRRVAWSFHPTEEEDLVQEVAGYWEARGVKVAVHSMGTSRQVSVSSRLLAALFDDLLDLGTNCYTKRLPDLVWSLPEDHKRAVLSGLWDGDGSWSFLSGGPNVVLEYGTASRELADGMLRLLGDLGIVARLKVGRTAKSTVDTYWLVISGAAQIADCHWLVPEDEWIRIRTYALRLTKAIAPTGYRRLSKSAAWVRVRSAERRPFTGDVFSVEVPGPHTVVASHGLVAHNCFPKDSHALVKIAEDAGYDFDLLKGVITVNDQQFTRVTDKIETAAGGSLDGVTIAVWGLTFKARTDDLRDSPSLEIVGRLVARGANVRAYDPAVDAGATDARLHGVEVCGDPYAACDGAMVLAILTEWDEFKWLDLDKVAEVMAAKRVVDGRNLMDRNPLVRRGFLLEGIGR
ncbi:MAG: nucleotide sugar dehydrogenase [Iamia sp.]